MYVLENSEDDTTVMIGENGKIKASEMLVAPRISEYFLKSLKF